MPLSVHGGCLRVQLENAIEGDLGRKGKLMVIYYVFYIISLMGMDEYSHQASSCHFCLYGVFYHVGYNVLTYYNMAVVIGVKPVTLLYVYNGRSLVG